MPTEGKNVFLHLSVQLLADKWHCYRRIQEHRHLIPRSATQCCRVQHWIASFKRDKNGGARQLCDDVPPFRKINEFFNDLWYLTQGDAPLLQKISELLFRISKTCRPVTCDILHPGTSKQV